MEAQAYFPLTSGWRWAYEVHRGGESMLATYAVTERIGDSVVVQAGEDRLAYALLADGIARRDGLAIGDYLLKTPLRAGASWPLTGGQAKVVAFGKTVTVPGGTFGNCITIEENRTDPDRMSRTIYAAGVGPISLEVQTYDPGKKRFVETLKAELRGVTRPGEDPLK